MDQASSCPHCGLPIPPDPASAALIFASQATQTVETIIPPTFCGDEAAGRPGSAGLLLSPANGVGRHGDHAGGNPAGAPAAFPESDEFDAARMDGSSEFDPLASPVADPLLDAFAAADPGGSGSIPAALAAPSAVGVALRSGTSSQASSDAEPAPRSWPLVLLGSYASAMTLAVAWLLWQGYGRLAVPRETLPSPSRNPQGRRLDGLRPLAADLRTVLGRPLRVGSLELTPVSLTSERVVLQWSGQDGDVEHERGPDVLVLRLRLKNLSSTETFAPLEPSFVRRPDAGDPDSFLEMGRQAIENYPLAVSSERSIVGQEFATLKPGEEIDTLVASEPDAAARFAGPATWRIALRVSADRTRTVGVDLLPAESR